MKQYNEDLDFVQNLKSMKKKISLTDKETTSILSKINKDIDKDTFKYSEKKPLPYKYYFSIAASFVILIILITPASFPFFQLVNKNGNNTMVPNNENPVVVEEPTEEPLEELPEEPPSVVIFDQQHMQLEKMKNQLYEHANELERSDYIGYTYSIDQLYNYLLAIHYRRDQGLLDQGYKYEYFETLDWITEVYHTYVDFSNVELEQLVHVGYQIDIILSYTNKITNEHNFLNYHIDYGIHQLTDYSTFNSLENYTAILNDVKISGEIIELEITFTNKAEDPDAPNGFRLYSDNSSVTLPISIDVPIYLLKDPSTLAKVNWEKIGVHQQFMQIFFNERGEVMVIKELYLP